MKSSLRLGVPAWGQFVFVDPDTNTLIVKRSYFPQEEMDDLERETETFFKQVSKWSPNLP